ncbi:phosphoribosylaminoimidazole-succinocarboxamide synthase [Coniosporium apollinis CBS 100218]|uniref:Phosphoribosylaminoimidazole-succinocarboxamide synthase n=1 Tax=Coniosporium apollinis (strain CBS 100218) TaxID=1168221 RepID=R7YPR5_CONA1|nr:phosphoribosylaminoimidazole-succinocarboxamide synthase [Coniosporium apollinis CBS 100218]EON63626.1 phosphoribosylaminoimidazole-succinocarboxamide synthase [Coniosporium apollinis CBS 100218]
MSADIVLTSTDLTPYFPLLASGKVRDVYTLSPTILLFVATDRISAYDVVLANGIPGKGRLLTQMSAHWFSVLPPLVPSLRTHFLSMSLPAVLEENKELVEAYRGRSMQVRKLKVFPIESIVRGYITGSAWAEYEKKGTVHGMRMREGLRESEMLETPIWTPSTKAQEGHDENISPEKAAEIIGQDYADQIRDLSLRIYSAARDYALERGIIIADTKFEFALDESTSPHSVVLVDEVLTPDSSRFWDKEKYEVGRPQDSLDKQYLRDWLTENKLKGKESVEMPREVAERTARGYREAYERLTGEVQGR